MLFWGLHSLAAELKAAPLESLLVFAVRVFRFQVDPRVLSAYLV
jgi:hypothetical protein